MPWKHVCWRLQHICFPVNIAKILKHLFWRTFANSYLLPKPWLCCFLVCTNSNLQNILTFWFSQLYMPTRQQKLKKMVAFPIIVMSLHVVDLLFSHFLCKSLNVVCADYLIIFRDLLRILFATFFKCSLQKIT